MHALKIVVGLAIWAWLQVGLAHASGALPPRTLESVVSVLPTWPGHAQGGTGARPGTAPEGSGVVLQPGLIATAWHVVEPARSIRVRLHDGRIVPAELAAYDRASDIALLRVNAELAPIEIAPPPDLAAPVCAVGNAYGFGLSVTCGVVSAVHITDAGFNPVEDFVQTDAATNPGMSGGALVDRHGRLVGMLSAIFASGGQTNIGINFAVSADLLLRVTDALVDHGEVNYPAAGWTLETAGPAQLSVLAAPRVAAVRPASGAAAANVQPGDLIVEIAGRRTRTARDAHAALALLPDGADTAAIRLLRDGEALTLNLPLHQHTVASKTPQRADCPHPAPVCLVRQAVFPVSSFDPVGSATRIGPDLLVTNRHVVGDRTDAVVHTPAGPREARIVPSAFEGDLVLLEVNGLPTNGFIPNLLGDSLDSAPFYVVGADVARQVVRVFAPGGLIAPPADRTALGRIHTTARMQPGVSGGALVDETGELIAIAAGGGEERYEAIPLTQVRDALALRSDPDAATVTRRLGEAFAACEDRIEALAANPRAAVDPADTLASCREAQNAGQLLRAGRVLARAGEIDGAIALHTLAVEQVPNSINARMSLLVSLQLGARFDAMTEHARWLVEKAPDDPRALRFSVQSGVWGGDPELAEAGYRALLKADPRQADAARRFIDNAPPAPIPR